MTAILWHQLRPDGPWHAFRADSRRSLCRQFTRPDAEPAGVPAGRPCRNCTVVLAHVPPERRAMAAEATFSVETALLDHAPLAGRPDVVAAWERWTVAMLAWETTGLEQDRLEVLDREREMFDVAAAGRSAFRDGA